MIGNLIVSVALWVAKEMHVNEVLEPSGMKIRICALTFPCYMSECSTAAKFFGARLELIDWRFHYSILKVCHYFTVWHSDYCISLESQWISKWAGSLPGARMNEINFGDKNTTKSIQHSHTMWNFELFWAIFHCGVRSSTMTTFCAYWRQSE